MQKKEKKTNTRISLILEKGNEVMQEKYFLKSCSWGEKEGRARPERCPFFLRPANVLERRKKNARAHPFACDRGRRIPGAIFHRDSQQASIVPREPIFQRHLPEGKQHGQEHGRNRPAGPPLIAHYRAKACARNLIDITARNNFVFRYFASISFAISDSTVIEPFGNY